MAGTHRAGRTYQHMLRRLLAPVLPVIAVAVSLCAPASAQEAANVCTRAVAETVYVPAFSRIHTHARQRQPLASTLVVHNVDPQVSISLTSVAFYDEAGGLVQTLLEAPVELTPFASANFLTEMSDSSGGIGANYLLEWTSDRAACSPRALAVMIGGTGTHGISFSVEGHVIARKSAAAQ